MSRERLQSASTTHRHSGSGTAGIAGAMPLISVVIPSYNQAHFLGEAIASVIGQEYPCVEVIVVNDGSEDDTAAVVRRFENVRYLEQANRGLAAARNAGLALCRGSFVVFLDADDRLLPGALEIGMRQLAAVPAAGFAAGHSRFISGDGTPQPTEQPDRQPESHPYVTLLRRNRIRNPAMVMFRRHVVEEAGGFSSDVNACADYDLYLRISRSRPVVFYDRVVADYRKHDGSMSAHSALMLRQLLRVMRRQRPNLTDEVRRQAFEEGVRNIRSYYGDLVVSQIRDRIRTRRGWLRTIEDLATLAWWHPAGLIEHGRRKIQVARSRSRAALMDAQLPRNRR
jgi:glycosyltransferase involved in cell wall biosynthesis